MNHTDTTDSTKPGSDQGQTRRRLNNVIDEGVVDLREVLGIFLTYRWLISSVTVAALLFAVLYSILSTPIYRVDALLQVEEKISSGLSALGDITDILDGQSKTTAEIEILKSRMVMRDVIDKLNLDIEIAPKYFPVIG
ncbi:MAG TPA: tyrosine-protein kinase, partial [Porticoccaceae bacterium]|nr:tyrosine-protein kinase [Porticoccaceae bacterium]